MADTNKKEYTSNLHPKGDLDTTVYPNVKSESIIDKDTTAYNVGKVPDSSLVSKSLDGLNEKIETNKIQTDTNKTNIATLQGDVSSLKQDNKTTKTIIAGLVSDNTQNKKDIATLKANYTVVQSQANTNSSNIALLESNAIKKDTDASLKSLTLPSASDLRTKDGTSFGGGDDIFKIDISRFGETQKITLNSEEAERFLKASIVSLSMNNEPGVTATKQGEAAKAIANIFSTNTSNVTTYINFLLDFDERDNSLTFSQYRYTITQDLSTYATKTDLNAKQSTLYRHTVKISKATDDGETSITFTTSSVNNTPIDSIQDLTTVFGNTDLSVSGATFLISSSQWEFYNKIHVGTSITNTTVDYINKDDVGTYNFTDMFGTTGFTITDNVTAM